VTVSDDKSNFLLLSGSLESLRDETVQPLRLAGLDPAQRYRMKLLNIDQLNDHATRHFPSPLVDGAGLVLSGSAIMQAGIVLPFSFPHTMWVVEGKSVETT
jgi:alpha-galactosidase